MEYIIVKKDFIFDNQIYEIGDVLFVVKSLNMRKYILDKTNRIYIYELGDLFLKNILNRRRPNNEMCMWI